MTQYSLHLSDGRIVGPFDSETEAVIVGLAYADLAWTVELSESAS